MKRILYLFILISILISSCKKEKKDSLYDEQGRLHGTVKEYYPDSTLAHITHYRHGQKVDTEISYFESGNPEVVAIYQWDSIASVLHGDYFHYYDNGQLLMKGRYFEGLPDDTFRQWTPSSTLISEEIYSKGRTVGIWTYFDSSGSRYLSVEHDSLSRYYHENVKAGKFTWYDEQGNPVYSATWDHHILLNQEVFNPAKFQEMIQDGIIDTLPVREQ